MSNEVNSNPYRFVEPNFAPRANKSGGCQRVSAEAGPAPKQEQAEGKNTYKSSLFDNPCLQVVPYESYPMPTKGITQKEWVI